MSDVSIHLLNVLIWTLIGALVLFLVVFPLSYLLQKALTRIYKALPERFRQYLDDIDYNLHDFTCNPYGERPPRPWIAQHLTEEQWQQHRCSFREYTRNEGRYANFHGGTIGWLKREGLPLITPEMKAYLEKKDRQYEQELLNQGMLTELAEWRENKRRRQAIVEAIGT